MTGHQITKSIVEYISNFKYIKSTGSNYLFSNRVKNITDVVDKLNLKAGTYNGILSSTKELLTKRSILILGDIPKTVAKRKLITFSLDINSFSTLILAL